MAYFVRYGFGSDEKKLKDVFLKTAGDVVNNDEYFINSGVCFSGFIEERRNYLDAEKNPLYYSLSCNVEQLREIIKWVNSLNSGIRIKIEKIKLLGILVSTWYRRDGYSTIPEYFDFSFGNKCTVISEKMQNELGIKGLEVHRCAVKISIRGIRDLIHKSLLEYLVMVFIRHLDTNELQIAEMPNDDTSMVEKIIISSNRRLAGHCLSENRINIHELINTLNVDNINNIPGDKIIGSYIRQTTLIELCNKWE